MLVILPEQCEQPAGYLPFQLLAHELAQRCIGVLVEQVRRHSIEKFEPLHRPVALACELFAEPMAATDVKEGVLLVPVIDGLVSPHERTKQVEHFEIAFREQASPKGVLAQVDVPDARLVEERCTEDHHRRGHAQCLDDLRGALGFEVLGNLKREREVEVLVAQALPYDLIQIDRMELDPRVEHVGLRVPFTVVTHQPV